MQKLEAWYGPIPASIPPNALAAQIERALLASDAAAPYAKRIAPIAGKIILEKKPHENCFVSRKLSGLPVKIVFPSATESVFLLLPKKCEATDQNGAQKWGRQALICAKMTNSFAVNTLWNLSSKKQATQPFYHSHEIEAVLRREVGGHLFQECCFDFYQEKEGVPKRSCYYANLTCLTEFLNTPDFIEDRKNALTLAKAIATRLLALHKAGFAWLDCKSDNILLRGDGTIFFCDPDTATKDERIRLNTRFATTNYLPPEAHNLLQLVDPKKVDAFAFGCVLYQLLFDCQPSWFDENTPRRLDHDTLEQYCLFAIRARERLLRNESISYKNVLVSLIEWAMHPHAHQRPTLEVMLHHLSREHADCDDVNVAEVKQFMAIETRPVQSLMRKICPLSCCVIL